MFLLKYGFANARIKAMEAKLLDEAKINDMLRVNSLSEVTALLEDTPYKQSLVECSTRYSGLELLTHGLDANLAATFRTLYKVVPKESTPLLDAVLGGWEVQDLKKILSRKALGQGISADELLNLSRESAKLSKQLIKKESFDDVVDELKHSKYAKEFGKAAEEYGQNKDFRVLLDALDANYYNAMATLANNQKAGKETAKIINHKIGLVNKLIVLRMKRDGATPAQIREELVQGKATREMDELIEAKDVEACMALLKLEENARDKWEKTKSLAAIEVSLEKAFVENVLRSLRTSVLCFGTVLGYIYLKTAEVDNIRRIAVGKQFGIEELMKDAIYAVPS